MIKLNIVNNKLNEFLWSCAGVNKEILRLYPTDWAKYAGNGGTILFTAIMAMISGGYAMYFVFSNVILSVIFAVIWGLLIFNLDRFIVNSMYSDGQDVITWRKFKSALPRFIMAIFIGIVISTPLEMKIFNDRIETQLLKDNVERINVIKGKNDLYDKTKNINNELTDLQSQRNNLVKELQMAQKDLKDEAEGNALSGKAGHGSIYKDKLLYEQQCQTALHEWDKVNLNRLNDLKQQSNALNTNVENFELKIQDIKEDGFSARYEAFSSLRDNNQALNIVAYMITLLFILIEITPTFFKLIMIGGPYQEHLNTESYKIAIQAQKEKSNYETDLIILKENNQQKIINNQLLANQIEPVIYKSIPNSSTKPRQLIYSSTTPNKTTPKQRQKQQKTERHIKITNTNNDLSKLLMNNTQQNGIVLKRNKRGVLSANLTTKNKNA